MRTLINYAEGLYQALVHTSCNAMFANEGVELLVEKLRNADRVLLIGNGGSGAACDHMANDLCLAKVRAQALTNANNITCIANDFGFENVFVKQVDWAHVPGGKNVLLAFSCSGRSMNVINAAKMSRSIVQDVVTFSGFTPDNPLAAAGSLNFYVPSQSYGIVQLAHETLLHCAIDKLAGLY